MTKKAIDQIDDFNGKFNKLNRAFPELTKKLLKGDLSDRFFGGINSVSKIRNQGKDYLFIDTPGHGWIVDMSGKIVGEGDCGFTDKKLNVNIQMVFNSREELF